MEDGTLTEAKDYVEKAASLLGVATGEVWGAVVREALSEGARSFLYIIAAIMLAVILSNLYVTLACIAVGLVYADHGLSRIINPKYYAAKKLLDIWKKTR